MDHILKDSRFSHIPADPRFKRIPKWERKVKIDKRFQRMFSDDKFKVRYTTDKRGRPANTTSAEDLKRYYAISSDEEDSDSSEEEGKSEGEEGKSLAQKSPPTVKSKKVVKPQSKNGNISKSSKRLSAASSTDGNWEETDIVKNDGNGGSHAASPGRDDSSDDEGIDISSRRLLPENVKKKLCDPSVDYARGEGTLFTDSSSDEESTGDDADSESDVEHKWGELDKDAEATEEASRRLAICNMDWDRIRAQDLLVLLSSFLPATGGAICSVTIYPSEFGIQRMKEEEVNGPTELRESKNNDGVDSEDEQNDENDEETEEGRKYHMEKLRQYQLNRLRYYYAVMECDSVATAEHLYSECDGLEYESSATRLDLRFIPDDMTFDQEPHDSCNSLPEPGQYSPQHFTTTALQQAKVDLTWDETDPKRVALAKKLQSAELNDLPDADLQAYLASDTSEDSAQEEEEAAADNGKEAGKSDEEADVDPVLKYRQLLLEVEQQENERKKKNEGVEMEVTWGLGLEDKTKKLIKERQRAASLGQATPFQQILEKRKEKRKLKREQRTKLQHGGKGSEGEGDDQPFSDDDVPSDIDMNDPFFREEMGGLGAKGKNKMDKKRKKGGSDLDDNEEEKQGKAELELLMLDEEPSDKKHFSLKKIQEAEEQSQKKKKRLKKKRKDQPDESVGDDFQVNVSDERFQALFTSHHYNIDPADPHYRKTKGTEALRQAKLSRWTRENENEAESSAGPPERQEGRRDAELSQLVKSVKRNTKNLKK